MTEQEILKFWQENKIFEESLNRGPKRRNFVFYDGPPFATGLPHYGHILASIIKDVIPRYKTMLDFKVPRRWGWDCHGLPIENEIEKELGLKTKKDIEKLGIEKFNKAAKAAVLRYADEWKKIIPRIGRWVDMKNDYKTMDSEYTESVWWVFKKLFEKGLIYEDYKSMHICPRCETTLSNTEVTLNYQDIKDISVIVKFEILNSKSETNSKSKIQNSKTFILAWTTTPWTLPGNVALAINPSIKYVKIQFPGHPMSQILTKNNFRTSDAQKLNSAEYYILAKDRLEILGDKQYEVIETFRGKDLIGKKYKPLFDYYRRKSVLNRRESVFLENGWKIYGADFVSTEEGTGVVHIAPAFGEDDMNLGRKEKLPFIQHVSMDGKFKPEVKDFVGLPVKPKDNHQSTDIEIIKWLAKKNLLFSKEQITHSYPFCWRCDTPLLNYAANSWFVNVNKIKNNLIKNNKKINWIPAHLKSGRFGKWLEGARDWAISRSRYWGAPLPAWKCKGCGDWKVIGSIEEIKKNVKKSGNKYFVMRHGEAESNVRGVISSKLKDSLNYPLTKKGEKEIEKTAKKLKRKGIDLIFASDFFRTRRTAEIVAEQIGYNRDKIIFDKRLREIDTGVFNGKKLEEYHAYFSSLLEKFEKKPPGGENLTELKNRVSQFLYEVDSKYNNKNILIISHEYPIWLLFAGANGADAGKSVKLKGDRPYFVKTGELAELDFIPLPHNKNFEIDLHRPYIDQIELECGKCKNTMKRTSEVFDCWFESGSMPYGQAHYPFENKKEFERNFPAEFIAEGIDQTRGWFYTLLVLSTALFNKPAYKNVIVNGIILSETGEKMSKRLKNYPDPMEIVSKYGADALRYYLLSSPAVRGEDLNFSEKGVDEVNKKILLRLRNVYKFYKLYADSHGLKRINADKIISVNQLKKRRQSASALDKWILSRLEELKIEVSKWLDKYELDKAVRPIDGFIDDLSTWYIRRSRNRFKFYEAKPRKDVEAAMETIKLVLLEFSKIIAPFMPFVAEAVYKSVMRQASGVKNVASVHLESWPKENKKLIDKKLLEAMREIRRIASLALEARQKAGIKVRQPLQKLKVKSLKLKVDKELLNILKDEINVKQIVFDKKIKNEVELDTKITPELKAEGQLRELTRLVQGLRKEAGFTPKDKIYLWLEAPPEIKTAVNRYFKDFQAKIGAKNIELKRVAKFDAEEETQIDGRKIWLGIKKM